MPSYDSTRGRFRLAENHLAVLGHRMAGEEVPSELAEAEHELRQAGLTDQDGNLDFALSPLVSTLRTPAVILHVEALGEDGTLHHGVTGCLPLVLRRRSRSSRSLGAWPCLHTPLLPVRSVTC